MTDGLRKRRHLTSFQIIIIGFASVIIAGALLLMLPVSSKSGEVTPFSDTLFTSVSAVCVTGLVVHDTATHWSVFGQSIILLLIQTGGLGVVTVAASFAIISGRKISLSQRSIMQSSISAPKVAGIVRLTGFIVKATLLFELVGALAMMPVFVADHGARGIWMAFFHSISAFCNAGFDIMGTEGAQFASLTQCVSQPVINITVMLLIIIGGIGFLTWEDVYTNKFRFRRYRMQSKVILVTTLCLILVPTVFFFLAEFSHLPLKDRILASFFQAVTPRTAGFNTVDLTAMSSAAQGIIIVLMIIGAGPGSTAGGMKTTTFAVLIANTVAAFRRKDDACLFGRRIEVGAVKNASVILIMYVVLFFFGGVAISVYEGLPLGVCLYETSSAIGTVGLSLGITPTLGTFSRIILIMLMFFGRVGGLTLIYAALSEKRKNLSKLPQERITVG